MTDKPLPYKPNDWVADTSDRVARVKSVYWDRGEVLLDLHMFERDGTRLGRVSPAMGGPRSFEPACSAEDWRRIAPPAFPIQIRWVNSGGKRTAQYWAGETLPPANWTPRKKKVPVRRMVCDDRLLKALVKALEKIADGHNDPRAVAKEALGRK